MDRYSPENTDRYVYLCGVWQPDLDINSIVRSLIVYLIALYIINGKACHEILRDVDGHWSHDYGFGGYCTYRMHIAYFGDHAKTLVAMPYLHA